jgi:hypothetical protein
LEPTSTPNITRNAAGTSQRRRNSNQPVRKSWKHVKNRISDIPVGELSSVQWYEAQKAPRSTTEQADSIASSWSVLDRLHRKALAIPAIHQTTNTETKTQQGATAEYGALLSTDVLNWVVHSWRICAVQKEELPLTSQDIMLRLDRYTRSAQRAYVYHGD